MCIRDSPGGHRPGHLPGGSPRLGAGVPDAPPAPVTAMTQPPDAPRPGAVLISISFVFPSPRAAESGHVTFGRRSRLRCWSGPPAHHTACLLYTSMAQVTMICIRVWAEVRFFMIQSPFWQFGAGQGPLLFLLLPQRRTLCRQRKRDIHRNRSVQSSFSGNFPSG